MKNKCFDIGTFQAYIDGELASDLSEKVIKHIAICDKCATRLAETEEESAFAFSVLDEELNVLVPTERLRAKVFDSIREIEHNEKTNWWQKVAGGLGLANGFNFKSPGLVAFASVVLFVSMLAVGVKFYEPIPNRSDVALNTPTTSPLELDFSIDSVDSEVTEPSHEQPIINERVNEVIKTPKRIKPQKATGKQRKPRVQKAIAVQPNKRITQSENSVKPNAVKASPNLAEEGGYLQTIATLKKTVDMNKDMTLRPAERVAFERDMAVVNDAIKKMKNEVRKNPNNKAAREVLRASYKNKIDLLNSVAEKTELMASMQ